jgi:hypothetical protein
MSPLSPAIWHLLPSNWYTIDLNVFRGLYQLMSDLALDVEKCISGPQEFVSGAVFLQTAFRYNWQYLAPRGEQENLLPQFVHGENFLLNSFPQSSLFLVRTGEPNLL